VTTLVSGTDRVAPGCTSVTCGFASYVTSSHRQRRGDARQPWRCGSTLPMAEVSSLLLGLDSLRPPPGADGSPEPSERGKMMTGPGTGGAEIVRVGGSRIRAGRGSTYEACWWPCLRSLRRLSTRPPPTGRGSSYFSATQRYELAGEAAESGLGRASVRRFAPSFVLRCLVLRLMPFAHTIRVRVVTFRSAVWTHRHGWPCMPCSSSTQIRAYEDLTH